MQPVLFPELVDKAWALPHGPSWGRTPIHLATEALTTLKRRVLWGNPAECPLPGPLGHLGSSSVTFINMVVTPS